jgi:hypothetical protein
MIFHVKSLRANHLEVAKGAFTRLKDAKFLSLIEAMERMGSSGPMTSNTALSLDNSSTAAGTNIPEKRPRARVGTTITAPKSQSVHAAAAGTVNAVNSVVPPLELTWQAEILAYEGHHHEAAKCYARAGTVEITPARI